MRNLAHPPRPSSRLRVFAMAALVVSLASCPDVAPPVAVHAPDNLPEGVDIARKELVELLEKMRGVAVETDTDSAPPCTPGETHIDISPPPSPAWSGAGAQRIVVRESRCGDGRRIVVEGGSLMATQWAIYALAEAVGVRFFHPEETYVPGELAWPNDPIAVDETPSFMHRSLHAHRTHPIELSAPLEYDPAQLDMAAHQRRWVDWNVKMRHTTVDGWDAVLIDDYPWVRGFERSTGFNLLNSQQGGRPILDPDDPRPEEDQMAEAIEDRMAPIDGVPEAHHFGFGFNPSEFTEADPDDTVRRITFITDYMTQRYPDVLLWATNHGTYQPPVPGYGVRFYDLPQLAPPQLGVKVHSLMFYDLLRPAPVYGAETFLYLYVFERRQAAVRRIQHYPESSWWLTFDLPVPLFLAPVTLDARQYDIDALRDVLSTSPDDKTGIYGHHLFSSGQEWGYWLIDYCTARMSWNVDFTEDDCTLDFAQRFSRRAQVWRVLEEVQRRQVEDLRDPELLRFLVGSDDETEVAWEAGIEFHPLPPAPGEVLAYSDAQAAALVQRSLEPLRAMAGDYTAWAEEMHRAAEGEPERNKRYLRELRDSLEVFGLRAAHAVRVYETALSLRAALGAGDLAAVNAAFAGVEDARRLTERARTVIERRERDYRYPQALTIVGGEPGTDAAVENQTIYPYRYLSRTHTLFYWTRPDEQLAALFGEGLELVRPNGRVLNENVPLDVTVVTDGIDSLQVDWGDGTSDTALAPHSYAATGLYDWTLDATSSSGVIHHEDRVAVVQRRIFAPKGRLDVMAPDGAQIIEGLLPGLMVGIVDDGDAMLVLGVIDERFDALEDNIAARGSLVRRSWNGTSSGPEDTVLTLADVGEVRIYDAVLSFGEAPQDLVRLVLEGVMHTSEVIDLLVGVGGFDTEGARALVASILGYTADSLPEELDFRIEGNANTDP